MTVDPTGKHNARKAFGDIRRTHGVVQTALDSVWHWLNGVASGAAHFFTHSVLDGFKTVWAAIHTLVDAYKDFLKTYFRLYYWIQIHVLKYLIHLILHKYDVAIAKLRAQVARLIRLIYVATNAVLAIALHAVRLERSQRIRAVAHAEAQAKAEIRALHQIIEREAASAYRLEYDQRVSAITRILEFTVTRDPALRDVVGAITKGVLDLLAVDDPIARLALGFLIRDVIDKLGVDHAIGRLASDLLAPILGQPKPRNLHDVIADMGARLVAAESFEATFMTDGGPEVEQAGKLWRDITKPAAAAGIVAFTTAAILDPAGWAKAITEVAGTPANDLVTATANLVRGK